MTGLSLALTEALKAAKEIWDEVYWVQDQGKFGKYYAKPDPQALVQLAIFIMEENRRRAKTKINEINAKTMEL